MLSPIERLVPALLDIVLEILSPHDLTALSATNRILYSKVLPCLYQSIQIDWDNKKTEAEKLSPLLRTLINRPSLAVFVQNFTLDWQNLEEVHYRTEPAQLVASSRQHFTAQEVEKIEKTIDESGIEDSERWKAAVLQHKDLSAVAALLISRLIELRSLSIPEPFMQHGPKNDWIAAMFQHSLKSGFHDTWSSFRHLSVLSLGKSDCYFVQSPKASPHALILASRLPALKELECWGSYFDRGFIIEQEDERTASIPGNITSLKLLATAVEVKLLAYILKSQSRIKKIVYDGLWRSSMTPINLDEVRKNLNSVKETLTHLSFRYNIYANEACEITDLVSPLRGQIGPLKDFPNLVDLEISLFLLFGKVKPDQAPTLADHLPRGLQRLTINDDMWGYGAWYEWDSAAFLSIMSRLLNGVGEKSEGTDKSARHGFEELVFDARDQGFEGFHYLEDDEVAEQSRQLMEMCNQRGIRCSVLRDADDT